MIPLSELCLQSGTQIRSTTDSRVIAKYVAVLKRGEELPPATVYFDGATYHLADGFHRVAAWTSRGLTVVPCDVREGSRREAILFAVGANATHGLPRKNEDKRRAVLTLLEDAEWSSNTDRWIAEHCAVSHTFVSRIRAKLAVRSTEADNDATLEASTHSDPSEPPSTVIDGSSSHVSGGNGCHVEELVPADHPDAGGNGRHVDTNAEGHDPVGNGCHLNAGATDANPASVGNGCHVEAVELESGGYGCHLDTTSEALAHGADPSDVAEEAGAPNMRRGRDGKWYPVRLTSVSSATSMGDTADVAKSVEQRVLEPLFLAIVDRVAGASRYAIEQFAIMKRADQIAVLSFLVGGGAETLEQALHLDRTAAVSASMDDDRVVVNARAEVLTIDATGRDIPERVAPSMAEVPVLKTLLAEVRRVRRRWAATVKRYETSAAPNMGPLFRARDAIDGSLRSAERSLSGTAIPHAVCGYCKGREARCRGCGGAGWLGKEDHAGVPRSVSMSSMTADEMGWWLVPNHRTGT